MQAPSTTMNAPSGSIVSSSTTRTIVTLVSIAQTPRSATTISANSRPNTPMTTAIATSTVSATASDSGPARPAESPTLASAWPGRPQRQRRGLLRRRPAPVSSRESDGGRVGRVVPDADSHTHLEPGQLTVTDRRHRRRPRNGAFGRHEDVDFDHRLVVDHPTGVANRHHGGGGADGAPTTRAATALWPAASGQSPRASERPGRSSSTPRRRPSSARGGPS